MKSKTTLHTLLTRFALTACLFSTGAHAQGFLASLDAINDKARLEALSSVQDRTLVNAFYTLSEDGKKATLPETFPKGTPYSPRNLTEGSLTLRRPLFVANKMGDVRYEMREYARSPMDDAVGQAYVAMANARGNTVREYKPAMGLALNKLFEQNFEFKPSQNVAVWLGADRVLIEFDPAGEVVSLQLRSHQAIHNFTTRSFQYVNFIYGKKNGQFVQNKLPNSFFDENFLRTVSSVTAPEQPAAAQ